MSDTQEQTGDGSLGPSLVSDEVPGSFEEDKDGAERIRPPEYNSRLGTIGNVWKQYRFHKKRKKKASSGYVKWYLVDDSWPEPRWIKPENKGGGVREYEYDDEVYVFPRESMVADRRTGTWTVIHRKGEFDPISVQEPDKLALDAGEASEWLSLRVSSTAPGLLDSLDIDTSDLMTYLIFGIIALVVGQQVLSGGGIV